MSAIKPDVIILLSDDDGQDDDDDWRFIPDTILISSDDDEEDDCRYIDLDAYNKEEQNDADRFDLLNQGGNDLQELSLSRTKNECIQRNAEHERLKDGSGELLYPRSSFSIDCTGDACRGDVVLFKQNGGHRIVAGRIAKESYGASSEHTFTVEVLWSEGLKKLIPLSVLLVRGRYLYKLGTFRQPWKNEEERLEVLREKHERGRAARHKRKLMETEFASGGDKGTKRRKVYHGGPSQRKHISRIDKQNDVRKNTTDHNQDVWFQNSELNKSSQLTCHSDPSLQEESLHDASLLPNNLLPFGSLVSSHYNNEQGPNQALSHPPDHRQHSNKPPINRLTDGNVKARFPKSSFSINCTGDARERDIVMYTEHLGGKYVKNRTVAGRIVKVRKCGSRDQLKFAIKVLWTTYSKNLRHGSTIQVRSHNLYKFGTFRQPWKNEANRSKIYEEKHVPATRKQKLRKKADIASNKNKGMINIFPTVISQRFQASHKGPSSSKQPTQIAKQRSSKRKKNASVTPLTENNKGHKRKGVQLQKTRVKIAKQAFKPNLNTNLNPSLSTNPNLNLNQDTPQNPNQDTHPNQDPHSNPNPYLSTHPKPSSCPIPNPGPSTRPNPNTDNHQNPNNHKFPNPNKYSNLNQRLNPNLGKCPNPNPNIRPNLTKRLNPNLGKRLNSNPNICPNPNQNERPNSNLNSHTNPSPHANRYIFQDQLHESSRSLPHDGTFMPDRQRTSFSPSQPPFGFSGNGGQWGPNHLFIQPPGYFDYNQLILLGLMSLMYQQPR